MVQRRPKQQTAFSYVIREERFKTEGGSDEENAQDRWKELLQQENSENEIISYNIEDLEYKGENEEEEEIKGEPIETNKKRENFMQTFFNKSLSNNITNKDLIDVFDSEEEDKDDIENLDDLDINEKYRNETLKLSSHGTTLPKTITFLQEKFKSPTNSSSLESQRFTFGFQDGVKGPTKINMMNSMLQNKKGRQDSHFSKEKGAQKIFGNMSFQNPSNEVAMKPTRSRKESQGSRNFNEIDFSENVKDLKMKKLLKYTNKQKSLMEKLNSPQSKPLKDEKGNRVFYMLKGLNDGSPNKSMLNKEKSKDSTG